MNNIALCHGTFDLWHLGHVLMTMEARTLAPRVIVTLTADAYVNKGPGRPMFTETERRDMILSCRYVDEVHIIHEKTGMSAIERWKPAWYIKGADYLVADKHGMLDTERKAVEAYGGQLHLARHAGYSSSGIIDRVRRQLVLEGVMLMEDVPDKKEMN